MKTDQSYRALALTMVMVLVVMGSTVALAFQSDADDGGTAFLLDKGNGEVHWVTILNGGSVGYTVANGLEAIGIEYSLNGDVTVDGVGTVIVGGEDTGGSMSQSGSTGVFSTVSWMAYVWTDGRWEKTCLDDVLSSNAVALGYYPEGFSPTVTPDHRSAWTMSRGDAANSGSQTSDLSESGSYETAWIDSGTVHANMLYAGGYIFQKYGMSSSTDMASLVCFDAHTGEEVWTFQFSSGTNYESSTPLIVGDYIYMATMTGYIYRIPWAEGPGEGNGNVTSYGGVPMDKAECAPSSVPQELTGYNYNSGYSSMIFSQGAIYVTHSNGMVYCFDLNLNLIWSYLLEGSTYLVASTMVDGLLYVGVLNGHVYIFDGATGECLVDETVYQVTKEQVYGNVGQMAVIEEDPGVYYIYATVSDGHGMSQMYSGIIVYRYDSSSGALERLYLNDGMGTVGRYVLGVDTELFTGAYVLISDGVSTTLYRIGPDLELEAVIEGLAGTHSAMVLVNGQYIFAQSYSSANQIYQISLNGTIVGTAKVPAGVRNFNMVSILLIDGMIFCSFDTGIYALVGGFTPYENVFDGSAGLPIIGVLAIIILAVVLVLAAFCYIFRYWKGIEHPFKAARSLLSHYLYGKDISHNTRSRHRLKVVIFIGVILSFLSFTLCLCVGATSVLNPVEAFSALFSAVAKDGMGLDAVETTVFVSRLPRTIAALAVGIGLSMAGSIYQAIIKNPLVDPYIMGVSSGAGVAAIAVIAFNFTFFEIFSYHSIFLTAIAACIGGLIAFVCTMVLAERAGGSTINYNLAGVVVGLAFSSVQTLMLTMAGERLSNALSWLYGSFAEVTWSQVGVILVLSIFLSAVPLLWAKELNLVLLGEDQAKQMGLNVKRFNKLMLILASVLTSVCVAFCGIIGFVGLVIPHLCRMLLGSDHRMILPASICFGDVMLMLADLLARTGYYGMELPVGAITTVIGIPVFAYLLIKRGRMYDG